MAVSLKNRIFLRIATMLSVGVAFAVAMTTATYAQGSRPQLVVQMAEADVTADVLFIYGQKLLRRHRHRRRRVIERRQASSQRRCARA